MKFKFKIQQYQTDAVECIARVFDGEPCIDKTLYRRDIGKVDSTMLRLENEEGYSNHELVLSENNLLENIRQLQLENDIKKSEKLNKNLGLVNLDIEMETGTGKTYVYIKSMFELNKRYGWSKFVVVVPSIAIREGVYKSFQIMQEHFLEEYGKSIRFFIYNSQNLTEIDHFASDSHINVMIINSQAFNATGKDARRIRMKLDEFRSRRPIDVIASTNPILIIDEPQSVEGKKTKEGLAEFQPLLTLRYSATHRKDAIYNMVYRLDAMDAYNKHLVKKISVKGITVSGSTATEGYLYLEGVQVFTDKAPVATLEFDCKGKGGLLKKKAHV